MLVVHEVTRAYQVGERPVPAVRGVSLEVAAGSMTAVMGPSGCGKSTLLTVAGGLQPPDSGTVEVAGIDLGGLSEAELYEHRRRHVGFVFQDFNLVHLLSAVENVALPLELDGTSRREAQRVARDALGEVGMADFADRLPQQLSGGEQQRVALARAICGDERLILADEPTGALDSSNSEQVLAVLRRLVEGGATCVVVTHSDAVAAGADRLVRMRDGVLEGDAPSVGAAR